jgi:hypothetical protein
MASEGSCLGKKWPGFPAEKVILLHDNAYHHTTGVTMQLLEQFYWEWLAHPQYSLFHAEISISLDY